ncbi:MAG: adenosine deaminase [Anaerolineae bacterium]|jgi:adenosine deaminase|nr:MAG: adenosine deaminase [Anaerolineae bacterium]
MIDPSFPLIDLHRHLDGNVRLRTILELADQHGIPLPASDEEGLRPYVQVTEPQPGVMAFLEKFRYMVGVLADYEACRRIAYENVLDAQREGLDYVELRFSPLFMAQPHQLHPQGVVEAVLDGITAARRETGMMVNLIGILSRTYGQKLAWQELEALLAFADQLVAIDLAGDEANYPGEWFTEHLNQARQRGLHLTVHAGEAAGPSSVWQAVRELKAERLGHAVHAIEDPALMDYLAEKAIGIEANLTSNVQTSTVSSYAAHPLRQFLAHGLLATINTDDPGISGIDLRYEYEVAAPAAGLSPQQIAQAQRNALTVAFLSPAEKQALVTQKQAQKK